MICYILLPCSEPPVIGRLVLRRCNRVHCGILYVAPARSGRRLEYAPRPDLHAAIRIHYRINVLELDLTCTPIVQRHGFVLTRFLRCICEHAMGP